MFRKNLLIGAAACAALAISGWTRADVNSAVKPNTNVVYLDDTTMPTTPAQTEKPATPTLPGTTEPSTDTAAAPASAPAAPVTPLNGALANIPHYGDTGISATGYVEGSWTYSSHPPAGNILSDRVFDNKTESIQFDAAELQIARTVDYTTKTFNITNIGFDVEAVYGWDGAFLHSNGLSLYSSGKQGSAAIPGAGGVATIHPKAQVDLVQANFTIEVPVGNGLGIEGGKFDTLVGYEVIDAPSNPFFSHSYIFDEEPFTHTGLLGIYNLIDPSDTAKSAQVTAGFSRGWDQATEDDNGSLDIMGQIKYTLNGKFSVVFSGITGDENASGVNDGWRTVLDLNGSYTVSDQITLGYNGMYAWQAQTANGGAGGGTGQWYGAAIYGRWVPNEYLAFNVRAEWFDDQDGAAPTQLSSGLTNIANQFYEVTIGLTYKPFADNQYLSGLAIRPEGRWDYSGHAAFNGGAQNDQWTAAVEAYFAF